MKLPLLAMLILCVAAIAASAQAPPRTLSNHPGNIFIAGETVKVAPPPKETFRWQLLDYDGKVVVEGPVTRGSVELGELSVGYYELRGEKSGERVTLGVIAPLTAPTPDDSPISIDV